MPKMGFVHERRSESSTRYMNNTLKLSPKQQGWYGHAACTEGCRTHTYIILLGSTIKLFVKKFGHLDRLQNECTNCKGAKNNTNFGQINGMQEKLDTTCK